MPPTRVRCPLTLTTPAPHTTRALSAHPDDRCPAHHTCLQLDDAPDETAGTRLAVKPENLEVISNAISDPSETAVTAGEGASAGEAAEEAMAAAYTAVYEYEVCDVGNEDNGRVGVEVDGHPSCCIRSLRYTRHIRYSGAHCISTHYVTFATYTLHP